MAGLKKKIFRPEEEDNNMDLKQKIENDFIKAFKEKNEAEVLVLRGLKSVVKNAEIQKKSELTEDDLIKLLNTEIKKRQDAIEQYQKGQRLELAEKEQAEVKIIERYMPAQLSDKELEEIIRQVVEKNLENSANFGKIMGEVVKEVKGRAPGTKVSQKVKEILASN